MDAFQPLSRPQIARIVNNDPEAIRYFENLFRVIGQFVTPVLSDGDKGDVILSGGATVWTLDYPTVKTGLSLSGVNTGDQTITLTGDVTGSGTGSFPATIANDAVTFAKMQNATAASRLVGRGAGSGAGDFQEITLGTNLSMSGTTLNASGGGGGSGDMTLTWMGL